MYKNSYVLGEIVPFVITSLDPWGKGVCLKEGYPVLFVEKALPEEEGMAIIVEVKSKVCFALISSLTRASPLRNSDSEKLCESYQNCFGCVYRHVSYEQEIFFKKKSLESHFRNLISVEKIEFIGGQKREFYRNRVTLHYDREKNILGYKDPYSFSLNPIKKCFLLTEKCHDFFKTWSKDWWQKAPQERGHVEFYEYEGKVGCSWDLPYVFGGFRQVNEEMNQKLKESLQQIVEASCSISILELFGGSGNLTSSLTRRNQQKIVSIDKEITVEALQKSNKNHSFISLDLFSKDALDLFCSLKKEEDYDCLILDPPRSGLKHLKFWVKKIRPRVLIYISCNPMTLIRDLQEISSLYELKRVVGFDFFPATAHMETMTVLEIKEKNWII